MPLNLSSSTPPAVPTGDEDGDFAILRRRSVQAALLVGFWTLVGLLYTGGVYLHRLDTEQAFTAASLWWNVVGWYSWIPSTLIVIWLVRQFPISPHNWYYLVPLHAVSAVLNSLLGAVIYACMRGIEALLVQAPAFAFSRTVRSSVAFNLGIDSLLYLMIVTAVYAFAYYRKYRERKLRAAQLQTALAEAQLQVLRMQLQPHFLFNTFNTIAMLVRQQRPDDAIDTIARLSGMLRHVLDHAHSQEVALEREVEILTSYVAIEQIRFGDRLTVHLDIDPEVRPARVPSLLLQPLVENAIRHGIAPAGRPGEVTVRIRRRDDRLHIEVHDNGLGPPIDRATASSGGLGLSTTKARLDRLYGPDHRFELHRTSTGGACLFMDLPYRPAADTRPASVLLTTHPAVP